MNAVVEKIQSGLNDLTENFKETVQYFSPASTTNAKPGVIQTAANTVKKSFVESVESGAKAAGMTTKSEVDAADEKNGTTSKAIDTRDPEKASAEIEVMADEGGELLSSGIYRYGLLLIVIAMGVLSLTKMLPTEQVIRMVKNN